MGLASIFETKIIRSGSKPNQKLCNECDMLKSVTQVCVSIYEQNIKNPLDF